MNNTSANSVTANITNKHYIKCDEEGCKNMFNINSKNYYAYFNNKKCKQCTNAIWNKYMQKEGHMTQRNQFFDSWLLSGFKIREEIPKDGV